MAVKLSNSTQDEFISNESKLLKRFFSSEKLILTEREEDELYEIYLQRKFVREYTSMLNQCLGVDLRSN